MTSLEVEDRYPLRSHRGNMSGKASAVPKSRVAGEWWRSDPITGDVPTYVERNVQFHVNQGPVDMEIKNARATSTLTTVPAGSNMGTWLPKPVAGAAYRGYVAGALEKFREFFIWHVHTEPVDVPFAGGSVPTKF